MLYHQFTGPLDSTPARRLETTRLMRAPFFTLNPCFCIPACQTTYLWLNGRLTIPAWEVVYHRRPLFAEGVSD
jgi:hypothetical protein